MIAGRGGPREMANAAVLAPIEPLVSSAVSRDGFEIPPETTAEAFSFPS